MTQSESPGSAGQCIATQSKKWKHVISADLLHQFFPLPFFLYPDMKQQGRRQDQKSVTASIFCQLAACQEFSFHAICL